MTFQIQIQPSGRTFTAAQGENLLSAAIAQGVPLPYGCKDGACGSCKCLKLSGEVTHGDYQPQALSAADAAAGYILCCRAEAQSDVVLENRQVGAEGTFAVKKLPTRVVALKPATDDVMLVTLQLPAGEPLQFHAGQYIEFILRDNARRAYSMATPPHLVKNAEGVNTLELHIRHMPGGKFTDQVFASLKEKDILRAEGPYGSFYLRNAPEDAAKPIVLLASGTGFAPIKALIQHMQQLGVQRPIALYWGARRPKDLYQHDWVLAQQRSMPNLSYVPVVSDALPEDGWSGRTGFVHHAVMADVPTMAQHQVYACGAPVVVESAREEFVAQCGLAAEAFFADSFTSEKDKQKAQLVP